MEKWDTDSQLDSEIRLLSGLRCLNPSVSMGGQWQRYITPDVYCYVRRYRDSICFVAMNRTSSATKVAEVATDLPNGEHTCVLTRRKFEVVDGKLHDLELEPLDVIVLSHVGDRVKAQTIVRAGLNQQFSLWEFSWCWAGSLVLSPQVIEKGFTSGQVGT